MAQYIQHEGVVTAVNQDSVQVHIEQTSACSGCHAKSMCMASEKQDKYIDCTSTEQLKVGDRVCVYVARKMGFKAVLLAFILPFCLLLGLIALLDIWIPDERISGTIALSSLIPYYGILALCKKKMKQYFVFYAHKI